MHNFIQSNDAKNAEFSYSDVIEFLDSEFDTLLIVDSPIHMNELSGHPFNILDSEFYVPFINTNNSLYVDSANTILVEHSTTICSLIQKQQIKQAHLDELFLISIPIYSKNKNAVLVKITRIKNKSHQIDDYYLVFSDFSHNEWRTVYRIENSNDFVPIYIENEQSLLKKLR